MRKQSRSPKQSCLLLGSNSIPVLYARNQRARRYVMRVTSEGAVRITIPHGGCLSEAQRFLRRNVSWVDLQLHKISAPWTHGTEVLLHGQKLPLQHCPEGWRLGPHLIPARPHASLRESVESHLRHLAGIELAHRTRALAQRHGFEFRRLMIRSQRTRWGSCSSQGTISLNWKLVQTPDFVRDYIILHELTHLREMNHSGRFWRALNEIFPRVEEAEHWLRTNADMLR